MKSLYDKNYRYTTDGTYLDQETIIALGDLFARYVKKGYSPREISHVIQSAIEFMECEFVLSKEKE